MTAWLSIVGIGEDGLAALRPDARAAIDSAELLVGGERHLALLPPDDRERKTWPSPLMQLVDEILNRRGTKICILATGDPLHYGIGVTFAKRLPKNEIAIYPAVSAFSLAAARKGWDLSRTNCLTLHGRPLEGVIPHLLPGARIIALSDGGNTPSQLAELLVAEGYGGSEMTILEHMNGPKENIHTARAADIIGCLFEDFNTIALECIADPGICALATLPGLPDDAFFHDGQLTKQEIRSATLSALTPLTGQLLWDVGAGCGSIGIEWMRCHPANRAIAVENREGRLEFIHRNRQKLGTPGLDVISGKAPEALEDLPAPDAVFIGGGLTQEGLFDACWSALRTGGRLVANAVTVEGEHVLFALHAQYGGSLTRIDISRAEKIGNFTSWKPFRQVTQFRLVKK